ncbi:MAG: 2-hydroxyglutaryl-CoA dehydratase [Chitinivibrionales bacterium]|nr:2-hydroxyglutaryl-CoA dehydratase [Chitinivibrionales bacterium]
MKLYLGIDIGSISAKGALIDQGGAVRASCYMRTNGKPIEATKNVLRQLRDACGERPLAGAATTGSGRKLAGIMIGADIVKNEIIAHAVAAARVCSEVHSIIEIGGQDSKFIMIRDGIPVDFAMNTVCAAGTGSFLDHQADRLDIPIERFGELALHARNPTHIASRCTVFAESDMIHKAQLGVALDDIVAGLCDGIVRNYLGTVAKGKQIVPPVFFQGGVAANVGVRRAFEKALGLEVVVPEHFLTMGALGAALLALRHAPAASLFIGFDACEACSFESRGFNCGGCHNGCEIVEALRDGRIVARYGGLCQRWH